MVRRALIIIIALALAVAGTWIILEWVNSATERELADVKLVDVLVAATPLEEGTPAAELVLGESVTLTQVLARSQVPGAVVELADLDGLVLNVPMVQGEQLTTQKFVEPSERILDLIPTVEIPDGYLQVSFELSESRLVSGKPQAGDYVAFIATFEPFTIAPTSIEPGAFDDFDELFAIIQATEEPGAGDESPEALEFQTPNTTHILLHKVLVADVKYGEPPVLVDEEGNPVEPDPRELPNTTVIVTLAAPAPDIERMVFTYEFGSVWLALEPLDAPEDGTDFITRGNVFP